VHVSENAPSTEQQHSPRENLLIEHPSMFVRPSLSEEEKQVAVLEEKRPVVVPTPHKK